MVPSLIEHGSQSIPSVTSCKVIMRGRHLTGIDVYGCYPLSLPLRQTEKAKSGAETCSGLDEAGNHLGDITPGFFVRQVSYCTMHTSVPCQPCPTSTWMYAHVDGVLFTVT